MGFLNTLKHFKNYFGATLATKALTLISIPVLTKILGVSPSDYGIISLFTSYVNIFICLITVNTYVGISRYYYEDRSDFASYFGTTINLNAILLVFSCGVVLYFIHPIAYLLDLPPLLCVLLIPAIICAIANSIFTQLLSAQQKSGELAIFSIITAYICFAFTIVFTILNPNRKYLGSIYAQILIGFFSFLYITKQLTSYYQYSFRRKHIRYMLHYSVPLIPYFLSSVILGQFDRIMIAKYQNINDAGLYSFAYNIGMLLTLFFSSLNSAWIPQYYVLMKEKKYDEYDKEVSYMHRLTLLVALGLIYFGSEIGKILGSSNFHFSLSIIPVVVIGYLFYSYFYFWEWNIDFAKKTFYSSLIVGSAGIINIILNFLFIPAYGYIAAAYTTMFSYFSMALFAWFINKYIIKLYAVRLRKIYPFFLLFATFTLSYYMIIEIEHHLIQICLKCLLLGLFSWGCFAREFKSIL